VDVDWLAPVSGDRLKAACRYCSCIVRAHYSDLRHHYKSAKHQRNAEWAAQGGGQPPMIFNKVCVDESKFAVIIKSLLHIIHGCHSHTESAE